MVTQKQMPNLQDTNKHMGKCCDEVRGIERSLFLLWEILRGTKGNQKTYQNLWGKG